MLDHVLVPLDGSELSERALDYAKKVVGSGGKITLLSVIDVPEYAVAAFYSAGVVAEATNRQVMIDQMIPQTHDYLDKIAKSLREAGYSTNTEAIIGEAANAIIEKATALNVDVIVMSTHGRSGFSRWLFGSVTNKVLSRTARPVFVIPSQKEEVNHV
ncbi:MAG: universal stress protein [Aggregatilineales bacterium]